MNNAINYEYYRRGRGALTPLRLIFQSLLLLMGLVLALKYRWRGMQVFLVVYFVLFAYRKILPAQMILSSLDPKNLPIALLIFTSMAMWSSRWIHGFMFEPVEEFNEVARSAWLIRFLAGDPVLQWFWSIVGGVASTVLAFTMILLPVGFLGSRAYLSTYVEEYQVWPATLSIISIILGINKRIELVRDGKSRVLVPPGAMPRFGGKGFLIVEDGHAVALERGGRITKVVGAGITFLERFERSNLIAPLRAQTARPPVENVVTKDGVIIQKFDVRVFYQIDSGNGKASSGSRFPFSDDNIMKLWKLAGSNFDNIRSAMDSIVDNALRDVIARYDLDEIFVAKRTGMFRTLASLEPRQRIKDEIRDQVNKVSLEFLAIKADGIEIGEVRIPEEAEKRLLEKWLADLAVRVAESEKQAVITRGEADAEVLRAIENVRASAQNRMIRAIREAFDQAGVPGQADFALVVILRFIEALEKMADEPSARVLFPYGLPLPELDKLWPLLAGGRGVEGVTPLPSLPPTEAESGPEGPSA